MRGSADPTTPGTVGHVLTTALATNPVTPPALVAALADQAASLGPTQIHALAAHPNLPTDHPVWDSGDLLPALTCQATPPDRAARIAASASPRRRTELLLQDLAPHPALFAAAWADLQAERLPSDSTGWVCSQFAAHHTCPPDLALAALRSCLALLTDPLPYFVRHPLAWAGAAHPEHLPALAAAAAPDPQLAALLTAAAATPDPRGYVLTHLLGAARTNQVAWDDVVAACGADAARAILTDPARGGLAEVLGDVNLPPDLRARALLALAANGTVEEIPDPHTLAEHLTDDDVDTLVGLLPPTEWADLCTGAHLGPLVLCGVWSALRERRAAGSVDGTTTLAVAHTLAAHDHTPDPVRHDALTVAEVLAANAPHHPGLITARHRAVTAALTGPTRATLPVWADATARRRMPPPGSAATAINLTRHLSAALTPGLLELATPARATAAAALLPSFTGTWDELVQVASTITT